ncbi:MAG: hypothetical protein ACK5LE_09800 [Alphaproteobacteria bacterium]
MKRKKYHCSHTPDLFSDLPEPMPVFAKEDVRAGTVEGKIALAVSKILKDDGRSRDDIATAMAEWLGDKKMSGAMLNAYSSQARDQYKITVARFWALIEVTKDIRLLQEIANSVGYIVLEERYAKRIKQAEREEQIDTLKAQIAALEAEDD